MKIHIAFEFKEGPWGGGNQFLKALRDELSTQGRYEPVADRAQVVIFNSYPSGEEYRFRQAYRLKRRGVIVVHRVDGPISVIRGRGFEVDRMIYDFNSTVSDGTVFQSPWSQVQNAALGMRANTYETVIVNAPNPGVFNTLNASQLDGDRKIRLIATSWSANPRKGFSTYEYLDQHLDFNKYEMTFVGRSPNTFENIEMIDPLESEALAAQLKRHDIFITASSTDPCSNSLIEALHCGLPAAFLNDGGHPWIVGNAGESFGGPEDALDAIDKIADNYPRYQNEIDLPEIATVADRYYEFAETIYRDRASGRYSAKSSSVTHLYKLLFRTYLWRIKTVTRR